jgi:hypothetical protein
MTGVRRTIGSINYTNPHFIDNRKKQMNIAAGWLVTSGYGGS